MCYKNIDQQSSNTILKKPGSSINREAKILTRQENFYYGKLHGAILLILGAIIIVSGLIMESFPITETPLYWIMGISFVLVVVFLPTTLLFFLACFKHGPNWVPPYAIDNFSLSEYCEDLEAQLQEEFHGEFMAIRSVEVGKIDAYQPVDRRTHFKRFISREIAPVHKFIITFTIAIHNRIVVMDIYVGRSQNSYEDQAVRLFKNSDTNADILKVIFRMTTDQQIRSTLLWNNHTSEFSTIREDEGELPQIPSEIAVLITDIFVQRYESIYTVLGTDNKLQIIHNTNGKDEIQLDTLPEGDRVSLYFGVKKFYDMVNELESYL